MNQLGVTISIILLPGIVCAVICDKLTVHSKWDAFKFTLYSFVLGLFAYTILQFFHYLLDAINGLWSKVWIWHHLKIWSSALSDKTTIPAWEVFWATICSVPAAFFSSWVVNYKFFNKIGQKIKITHKYGDENLFSYYLNAKEIDWIYVRDTEKNLTYQGRVVSSSENDHIQELVLSEVTVFRYEDSSELYSVPTIYLSKEMGKFIIEAIPQNLLGECNGEEATN